MLEKGFSVKFSFGFPAFDYGYSGDYLLPNELQIKTTYGLEIGNQWYFLKKEHFGLGLDVNWFDILYGYSKFDDPSGGPIKFETLESSFLEFGPVITIPVNNILAFEGYYNLMPTYFLSYYYENSDDYVLVGNFSFMNGLGVGVRLKFVYLGYEYTFGTTNGTVSAGGELEDFADMFPKQEMNGTNSKLIIGFQF